MNPVSSPPAELADSSFDFSKLLHQFFYDAQNPILFNSSFFIFFLLGLFLVYQFTYEKPVLRIVTIITFSLYFFYKACGYYVAFVLIAAVVDFNLSNFIYRSEKKRTKNILLTLSIILNLGLLCYFKYTNLLLDTLNELRLGHFNLVSMYLPIGISFYTFENLSYTIDVYRGTFKPVNKFIDYLFFLSFFPKLMMGPIVRASDFIPQIRKKIQINRLQVAEGLFLILSGCFKKIVISDYLHVNLVQNIFDDPSRHTGMECLFAVYGYALVIYCDFSGYSDMAIGIAKWLGFDILKNFNAPYISQSITEFWKRWHISLSSWLKDYLYISLGGNRKGKIRTYINLLITMLLGGLWHGANWNFVIWGGMHGAALAFHKKWMEVSKVQSSIFNLQRIWNGKVMKILSTILTFHFVCFTWIFFNTPDLATSGTMIHQIFSNFYLEGFMPFMDNYFNVVMIILLGMTLHFLPIRWNDIIAIRLSKMHWSLNSVITIGMIFMFIFFKQAKVILPVYLQF